MFFNLKKIARLFIVIFLFPACQNSQFKGESKTKNKVQNTTPEVLEDQNKDVTLKKSRIVFAVKEPGCIGCHANVKGDVVTDFMVGTSAYVGSSKYNLGYGSNLERNDRHGGAHSFKANQFATWNVKGNFIIPDASIEDRDFAKVINPQQPPKTILDALIKPIKVLEFNPDMSIMPASEKLVIGFSKVDASRADSTLGVDAIKTVKNLKIEIPKREDFNALKNPSTGALDHQISSDMPIFVASESQKVTGFVKKQGSQKAYVEMASQVNCGGDVLIDASLVIRDSKIVEGDCRLYVLGTIFIQGKISFQSSDSSIQLASYMPVFAGIKQAHHRYTMHNRENYHSFEEVDSDVNNVKDFIKEDAGPLWIAFNENGYLNPIAVNEDEQKIVGKEHPSLDLTTALWKSVKGASLAAYNSCVFAGTIDTEVASDYKLPVGANCAVVRNGHYQRKKIDFERIFILTPELQSRYWGKFSGSIVAQTVGFAKGVVEYRHDENLSKKEILPLFKKSFVDWDE